MTVDLQHLVRALERSDRFLEGGEPFSALAELGAVLGSLSALSPSDRELTRHQVATRVARIAPSEVDEVQRAAHGHAERLRRILSIDSNYLYEEVVLLLTLRIELALVDRCLRDLTPARLDDIGDEWDDTLRKLATSPRTRDAYRSAASAIERNWRGRTPFDVAWLGVESILSAGGGTRGGPRRPRGSTGRRAGRSR